MYPVSVLPGPAAMGGAAPSGDLLAGGNAAGAAGGRHFCAAVAGGARPAALCRGSASASGVIFAWALRRTKITGTLTHM